jgi:hypothetical protein
MSAPNENPAPNPTPTPDPTPNPAPNPAPNPPPPAPAPPSDNADLGELKSVVASLVGSVQALTETVAQMGNRDTAPRGRGPWLAWGSDKR